MRMAWSCPVREIYPVSAFLSATGGYLVGYHVKIAETNNL
jgi:hypothetical protein